MSTIGPGCTDQGYVIDSDYTFVTTYTMPSDGNISSFCVYANNGGDVKLKVFRVSGSNFLFIGESAWKTVSAGLNTGLSCSIDALSGDYLGIAITWPVKIDMSLPGNDYRYTGDVTTDTPIADWNYGDHGIISFQATYNPTTTNVYVDINKTDDTGNGLSWATAKKNMSAGYTLVDSGGTLHVATGDYSGQTVITYNKSFSLSPEDPNSVGYKQVSIPPSV